MNTANFLKYRNSILSAVRVFLVTLLLLVSPALLRAEVSGAFNQANQLYEQQKFADAATAYEKIIAGGQVSPALYFNLGNAWFKAGQTGRAITAYRHAEMLSPRDPDIRANLKFARNLAYGGNPPAENIWASWIDKLTLNEWSLATAAALWICFLLLTFGEWKRDWKKIICGYTLIFGIMSLVLICCLSVAAQHRLFTSMVVVSADEAVVRRGPFAESQSAFSVRSGFELTVLAERDSWLQVADSANRTGWLLRNEVLIVR